MGPFKGILLFCRMTQPVKECKIMVQYDILVCPVTSSGECMEQFQEADFLQKTEADEIYFDYSLIEMWRFAFRN